jgi:hypothetical protein
MDAEPESGDWIAGPDPDDDRIGCLDMLTATLGMGCAMSVRTLIFGVVVLVFYLLVRLAAGGQHHPLPTVVPTLVRGHGTHGGALILMYFFHLKKEFSGRVMNELHARVDFLHKPQSLSIAKPLDDHLDNCEGHSAE